MNTPQDSSLGREVAYPSQYDPGLLFPIPRAAARAEIHRLRRYQGQHSGPGRLAELFEALHRSLRTGPAGQGQG